MLKVNIEEKIYKMKKADFKALENINFEINKNGIVCILGESGSGKTTLMNILGAIDSEYKGDILIDNKSLKQYKDRDLDDYRNKNIGFIFQQFYLVNKLSVYDNIKIALEISNDKSVDIKTRVNELLKIVEMEEFAKTKVNLLSGGQKQRVAIARALANNPKIILADEPTGALDSKTSENIMEFLKEISKEKCIIMITHSNELAQKYASFVINIKDGKIVSDVDNKNNANNVDNMDNVDNVNNVHNVEENKKEHKKSKSMNFFNIVKYSFKNMLSKKRRLIATAIGMSIGIVGIGLAFALSNGTMDYAKAQINSVTSPNMVTITSKNASDNAMINEMSYDESLFLKYDDFYKIKEKNDKVKYFWAIPANIIDEYFLEASMIKENAQSGKKEDTSFLLTSSITPFEDLEDKISYGRRPNNKNEVVVSLNTAEDLSKYINVKIQDIIDKDIYIRFGDTSKMMSEEDDTTSKIITLKIVGITSTNTLRKIIYQYSEDTIKLFEELYNMKKEDMKFSEQYLYLDSRLTTDEIKEEVKKLNENYEDLKFTLTSESVTGGVETVLNVVRNVLIGFSSISVVVAILMIGIVIHLSVIERTKEIGILRAIGAKKRDIRNIFVTDAGIIGFLAGAIGVYITYILTIVIKNIVSNMLNDNGMNMGNINIASLDPTVAVALIFVCVLLAIIAGIIPANKASKLDPIVALRRG